MSWLPEPPEGTSICLGFDGSDVSDWTALKAETFEGHIFTPRFGSDRRPTIWNPAEQIESRVPREAVSSAVAELFERYRVERFYCDPPRWETDVQTWAVRHGEKVVMDWPTYRTRQMHAALERFIVDLTAGRITHDGCDITARHLANARKKTIAGDRYILAKPNENQKIDAAMATVLAHEAAADAHASGWSAEPTDNRVFCFT